MNCRRLTLLLSCLLLAPLAPAQDAPEDIAVCTNNLARIYEAIQTYRRENKELPDSISALYPRYINDPNLLVCPVARRQGLSSSSDPRTSYTYEFSPTLSKLMPGKTSREWKRAQMGLIGSDVPLVRCEKVHKSALNLGFGGVIYASRGDWENEFTNKVSRRDLWKPPSLRPVIIFRPIQVPPRDPAAQPEQLDLTEFYSGALTKPWLQTTNLSLAGVPAGLRNFARVRFDVRGVIQLSSRTLETRSEYFPTEVTNIVVGRACRRIHFLLGSAFQGGTNDAAWVRIHFANGLTREQPLTPEVHFRPTWAAPNAKELLVEGEVGYTGPGGNGPTLYVTHWENPPRGVVQSLDLLSSMNETDLFLLGITLEP